MHLLTNIILFLFLTLLIGYCPGPGWKYDEWKFPETPVNLSQVNSEYDDYNSAAPIVYDAFPLCFSSNRNSRGEDFDIVYKQMAIDWVELKQLVLFEETGENEGFYLNNQTLDNALPVVNSGSNELGPLLIFMGEARKQHTTYKPYYFFSYLFLYSSDTGGNQDIFLTHNLNDGQWESPLSLDGLNSRFNDCYPAWDGDLDRIYISSDRGGRYDIYSAKIDTSDDITTALLNSLELNFEKDAILSSSSNDKCPSVSREFIVFASDREGGYGGYDLYYSFFTGNWLEPINFGDKINTEYNEFRPIIKPYQRFGNDLVIFSSDRPGGIGGYDLYYAGIDFLH